MKHPNNTVEKIVQANKMLQQFWSSADGWAPSEAASLMSKSRLDRQVSLSRTLSLWVEQDFLSEGELILAWANLGALVEGTLKLFCSVYLKDYLKSDRIKTDKKGKAKLPDIICLEELKVIMAKEAGFGLEWFNFVGDVQKYRNAIHAYQDRDLGGQQVFLGLIEKYYCFIKEVNLSLPYPDGFDLQL